VGVGSASGCGWGRQVKLEPNAKQTERERESRSNAVQCARDASLCTRVAEKREDERR